MRYSSSVSTMKRKAEKQPSIRFRQSLFWDVDPKTIDPKKHASYIIERILDFGFDPEVRWLTRFYSKKKIKDVLRRSRVLHKKTKSLWEKIL